MNKDSKACRAVATLDGSPPVGISLTKAISQLVSIALAPAATSDRELPNYNAQCTDVQTQHASHAPRSSPHFGGTVSFCEGRGPRRSSSLCHRATFDCVAIVTFTKYPFASMVQEGGSRQAR